MKSEIKLKLVLFIVRKEEAKKMQTELNRLRFGYGIAALAEGTAKSEYLSMLGLSGTEKSIFYIVCDCARAYAALAEVSKNMEFDSPGGGIGLILPLMGICGKDAFDALANGGI